MSCRGQSAAATDGRRYSGQRAHLHRWCERKADTLLYSICTGCFITALAVCLLAGKCVGGQTALEMGLVNRAVEQNETGDAAYREALSLAREILPQVRIQTHAITRRNSSDSDTTLLLLQAEDLVFFLSPPLVPCPLFLVSPSTPTPLSRSSGLCRSVFLSLQFRCPQLVEPEWQPSGEKDHK